MAAESKDDERRVTEVKDTLDDGDDVAFTIIPGLLLAG